MADTYYDKSAGGSSQSTRKGINVVQCPECGAENPDGSLFCGLCTYRFAGYLPSVPMTSACEPSPAPVQREKFASLDELHIERPRERKALLIWTTGIIAVVVLSMLLVLALTSGGKNAAETMTDFVSPTTGLSFKYPSSWETKGQDYLKTLGQGTAFDSSQGNEVVLMNRGESIFKHLLIVSDGNITTGGQAWETLKPQLESEFQEAAQSQGTTIQFNDLHLAPATGATGIKMTYSIKPTMGPTLFEQEAFIIRGAGQYRMIFVTPLKGGGADETEAISRFTQITNSISFK